MIKKQNKKGISPLIATVLIIGFTIVLAALVITWGTKLFKGTVEETEATSKFNLACTTGLKLESTGVTKPAPGAYLRITLRNNNQARPINNFTFVLYDSTGRIQNFIAAPIDDPLVTNRFVALDANGNAISGVEDIKLNFPVPKIYHITSARNTPDIQDMRQVNKIDIYPIYTIEGTTRACESPMTLNV